MFRLVLYIEAESKVAAYIVFETGHTFEPSMLYPVYRSVPPSVLYSQHRGWSPSAENDKNSQF